MKKPSTSPWDGPNYQVLVSPSAVSPEFSPFVRELLETDSRIKVYRMMEDFKKKEYYVPQKDVIAFPFAFPTVEHEVGHMLEMTNLKRITQPDWGMSDLPSKVSASGFFVAAAREARARAIQRHLVIQDSSSDPTRLMNLMNNPFWLEMAEDFLPFGRFKNMKDVYDWTGDMGEKTYQAWSLDRIKTEWGKKIDYLRNWMETTG